MERGDIWWFDAHHRGRVRVVHVDVESLTEVRELELERTILKLGSLDWRQWILTHYFGLLLQGEHLDRSEGRSIVLVLETKPSFRLSSFFLCHGSRVRDCCSMLVIFWRFLETP